MAGKRARPIGKLGRAVRTWCVGEGVPQAELARRVGCHRSFLTQVVAGYRPSRAFLERLERATKGGIRADEHASRAA